MTADMLEIAGFSLFAVVVAIIWWFRNARGSADDRKLPVFSCFSFASTPDYQELLEKEMVRIESFLFSLLPDLAARRLNLERAHVTTSYVGMPVWACERDIGIYAGWLKGAFSISVAEEIPLSSATMKFRRLAVLDNTLVLIADDAFGVLKSLNERLRDVNNVLVVPDKHRTYTPHVSLYSIRDVSPVLTSKISELVAIFGSKFEVPYDFFFELSEGVCTPTSNWRIRRGAPFPGDITPQ